MKRKDESSEAAGGQARRGEGRGLENRIRDERGTGSAKSAIERRLTSGAPRSQEKVHPKRTFVWP